MAEPDAPLTITDDAAAKLREEADFSSSVLSVRHVLGCGGNGFRISVEAAPDEGHRFTAAGIPVVMDDYSWSKLSGAVLRVDPDPAGEGFRLDHPDAVLTTFC
jgi:Fe-S cluster assembly iron-binding protein IscA